MLIHGALLFLCNRTASGVCLQKQWQKGYHPPSFSFSELSAPGQDLPGCVCYSSKDAGALLLLMQQLLH